MELRARSHNERAFAELLGSPGVETTKANVEIAKKSITFDVKWRPGSNDEVVKLLENLDWGPAGRARDEGGYLGAEIEFLKRKPAPVGGWLIIVPQLVHEQPAGNWPAGKNKYRRVERERHDTRFGGFSSPEHVTFAKWLVGRAAAEDKVTCSGLKQPNDKGVLLVYPTAPTIEGKIQKGPTVMGFALVLPELFGSQRVAFTTYRKSDEVVVAKSKTASTANGSKIAQTKFRPSTTVRAPVQKASRSFRNPRQVRHRVP